MKPSEILNAALELMSEGWCQGAFVRDINWQAVFSTEDNAVSWCARGAVFRVVGHDDEKQCGRVLNYLDRSVRGFRNVTLTNDLGTALDVGRMFCRAIKLAKADGR